MHGRVGPGAVTEERLQSLSNAVEDVALSAPDGIASDQDLEPREGHEESGLSLNIAVDELELSDIWHGGQAVPSVAVLKLSQHQPLQSWRRGDDPKQVG